MATTGSTVPRRSGAQPEINVTPLVDVVLVLLIIFMVVTPQMDAGEEVELPRVTTPDPEAKGRLDPLELVATGSGRLLLERRELEAHSLAEALSAAHRDEPTRRLVLKGDARLPYGDVRALFLVAQDAGLPGVSLVVSAPDAAPTDGEG